MTPGGKNPITSASEPNKFPAQFLYCLVELLNLPAGEVSNQSIKKCTNYQNFPVAAASTL